MGWEIDQIDVKAAFLHTLLPKSEFIWICLPRVPGCNDCVNILRILKSLYGLSQAPKRLYQCFAKELTELVSNRSTASDCLFIRCDSETVFIVVYVGDLLVIGYATAVKEAKKQLHRVFTVTDLGLGNYFLGISVFRKVNRIFLS